MPAVVTAPALRLEPGETSVVQVEGDSYAVAPLPPLGFIRPRYRVRRLTPRDDDDEPPVPYLCEWSPGHGARCSCPAGRWRRVERCRHLLALADAGLIPEDAASPAVKW